MSLFDKFEALRQVRERLDRAEAVPFGVVTERLCSATEGLINGRPTVLAGTNNYLGLTFEPECLAAAHRALDEAGTGTTGSRMANGTYAGHVALEHELAAFYGSAGAIVFSTGYLANLGVISTLCGPDDVIVIDADSHASIYDGCRMAGSQVIRFRHNSPEDLARRLRRLGDRAANALIIVEGLYSMLGDQPPLAEMAAVKREYGGYLLVDEAHSLGVLGPTGRGAAEAAGVEADVDFIVGTFSKSLGAIGGFCVSNRPELELVRYAIRSYIFTASASPAVIASVRAALEAVRRRPELRSRLWANAERLHEGLSKLGLRPGAAPGPVVSVEVADTDEALRMWKRLLESGVYVNLVMPPATPTSRPLLRCSVSAAHSFEQIDTIVGAFGRVAARGELAAAG
jgi:8-amino-7-oxononanoate synthase